MAPYRPRFRSDIRIRKDANAPRPSVRDCAAPGCPEPGECRVPKSRENLAEYHDKARSTRRFKRMGRKAG